MKEKLSIVEILYQHSDLIFFRQTMKDFQIIQNY